ncbi:MAG: RHS repeat domain-containing protein [Armatimonadota bacterium]
MRDLKMIMAPIARLLALSLLVFVTCALCVAKPKVLITSPRSGAYLPTPFEITVDAYDETSPITRIDLYVYNSYCLYGGYWLAWSPEDHCTFTITDAYGNYKYGSFYAIATNALDETTESQRVGVNYYPSIPEMYRTPSLAIHSPYAGTRGSLFYSAFPALPDPNASPETRDPYISRIRVGLVHSDGYVDYFNTYDFSPPSPGDSLIFRGRARPDTSSSNITGYRVLVTDKTADNWEWDAGSYLYFQCSSPNPLMAEILNPCDGNTYADIDYFPIILSIKQNGEETTNYQSITHYIDGQIIYVGTEKIIAYSSLEVGTHLLQTYVIGNDGITYTDEVQFQVRAPSPDLPQPKHADPVNLDTGEEEHHAAPDLGAYNPLGASASLTRSFYSYRAKWRYASPGLSRGWVHNYDYTIRPVEGMGAWGPLLVTFPSGAQEALIPQLDGYGYPTGEIDPLPGFAQVVTGVPSATSGVWDSITIEWRGHTRWVFTNRYSGPPYVLSKIINPLGKELVLTWDGTRRLIYVSHKNADQSETTLLTLTYGTNGLLETLTDSHQRKVVYGYTDYNSVPCLTSVSRVGNVNDPTPAAHWEYDYTGLNYFYQSPLMLIMAKEISPSGGDDTILSFLYSPTNGRVVSQTNAKGAITTYTYNGLKDGARSVDIAISKDSVEITHWTQHLDSDGRDIGITDVEGHRTFIEYTDPYNPNKPSRIIGKDGKSIDYTYNQFGNITSVTTE